MRPSPTQDICDVIFFGTFKLSVSGRLLERNGVAVVIGARALDVLIALIEQAGETVTHQELLARVWPNLTVAESALRVHINKLRQVLGEGEVGARYIQNVAGRGYCFVAPVSRLPTSKSWAIHETRWSPQKNLPHPPNRMVGRDAIVGQIAAEILSHRFFTIIGPGGVGKTTVCIAVCHATADAFDDLVVFVDLGAISDPHLVITTIRSALSLPTNVDTMSGLLAALKTQRMLLVLDCCEHVVGEVTLVVEQIFQGAPEIHLLLTSREPLHGEGERVYNLPPLEFPVATETRTAREVLAFPAAKLFIDSVSARDHGFQLQDEDAPIVASICRRVDGIALALELAAGRVSAFGLSEVHDLLDGRMKLLWQGRRSATPRQKTLDATLDWSFRLLSELERTLLCRLSVFVGTFTLEDAGAVAVGEDLGKPEIFQFLGSLVDRSLVSVDLTGATPQYRLLDMTRQFARGKIENAPTMSRLAQSHANYFLQILTDFSDVRSGQTTIRQIIPSSSRLGNIHAALEWCFSAGDDGAIEIGMRLVVASGTFFLSQGLTAECRKWTETAIARLGEERRGTLLELELQIVLSSAHTLADYTKRAVVIDRAITLAHDLKERRQYLILLYQRLYDQAFWGQPELALQAAVASRAELTEKDDQIDLAIAEATIACISHTFGVDRDAHRHFGLAFLHLKKASQQTSEQIDEQTFRRMRATQANNLYTCGFFDQAATLGQTFIDGFENSKDFLAYAETMTRISFIFEWRQEWHKVANIYNVFIKVSMGQPSDDMSYVYSIIRCRLLMNSGEFKDSIAHLEKHLAEVPALSPGRFIIFVPLAQGLTKIGRFGDALAIMDEALKYEATFAGTGFRSEYLLCKAHILSSTPGSDITTIEETLRLSLEAARKQTSLSRELDAGLALAELLLNQRLSPEGLTILKPIYDRFTEGFATKVLVDARQLLAKLGDHR